MSMVWTGFRPGGSSSMTETSRSPYNVIANVRGIGVAVITITCGGIVGSEGFLSPETSLRSSHRFASLAVPPFTRPRAATVSGERIPPIVEALGPLAQSFERWSTPKRCCSSMMARPRARKRTSSSMSACVPMRMAILPSSRPACISRRSLAVLLPVRSAHRTPVPSRYLLTLA